MSERSWEWVESNSEALSLVQQRFGHDYEAGLTDYLNERWGSGWADSEPGAQQVEELGNMLLSDELPPDEAVEEHVTALVDELVQEVAALEDAGEFDPEEIRIAIQELVAEEVEQS